MKNKYSKIIALFLALSCLFSGTAFSADISADSNAELVTEEFAPGEVLVGLKTDVIPTSSYVEMFPTLDIIDVRVIGSEVRTLLLLTLREQTTQSVFDAIEVLENNEYVEYAEPNYAVQVTYTNNDYTNDFDFIETFSINGDISYPISRVYPNDLYMPSLWNMDYIDANEAWGITTGSNSIAVGVIDSGISPTADLIDNLDLESGINYVTPNTLPLDDNGHGTHVAGIIGAKGNNEIGVAGVCWDVTLVPFKVLDANGDGYVSDISDAIYAADDMGLPIINMSIQFKDASTGLDEAISAYDGLLVICAGNRVQNLDNQIHYPADFASTYDNVLVVGATQINTENADEELWIDPYNETEGSNYGHNSVHLFAPGGEILSTYTSTWGYYSLSGTSMATPHVAGTAALILSLYPNCTPEQLIDFITSTVDPLDCLTDYCITDGRLNVHNALQYFNSIWGNGDINMDGNINNIDLIRLARYLSGTITFSEDQLLRADLTHDGIVTEEDESALGQYLVQRSLNLEIQ